MAKREKRDSEGKGRFDFKLDFDSTIEGLDVDLEGLGFDIDFDSEAEATRYLKPRINPSKSQFLTTDTAKALAQQVLPDFGTRFDVVASGAFVFGEFIEALFYAHSIVAKRLAIATLSLNEDNIAQLASLANQGYIQQLDLIISHYFYANERHSLVPLLYEFLDRNDGFQLAVAGSHAKVTMFETEGGRKVVIHGSANLRANGNIEQFTIEENPELYDFYAGILDSIIDKYQTIDKAVRGKELWRTVEREEADNGE